MLTRQQGREQHQQQRPEIGDQTRLHCRSVGKSGEIERVIAEEAGNPQQPGASGLTKMRQDRCAAAQPSNCPFTEEEQEGDRESQRHQLEGRNFRCRGGEEGQRCPEQHGNAADQGGGETGRGHGSNETDEQFTRTADQTSPAPSMGAGGGGDD
jgi:hypothetical protein